MDVSKAQRQERAVNLSGAHCTEAKCHRGVEVGIFKSSSPILSV